MKILTIPDWPEAIFIQRGFQIARHLAALDNEVYFMVWNTYPYPRSISDIKENICSSLKHRAYSRDGVTIGTIPRLPFPFPVVNRYLSSRLISKMAKEVGIDVIISGNFNYEVEPPFDLPFIYDLWDHNEAFVEDTFTNIKKFALKHVLSVKKSVHTQLKHADAVTAVSDILVNYAKEIVPNTSVYKITNGVDTLFLEASLEKNGYDFGKYSMVYVSRFGKWTNLPKTVEATAHLRKVYPDIKLVLVGELLDRISSDTRKLVQSLGLSNNVYFLGHVDRMEVVKIINGCNIALCPFSKSMFTDSAFPIKIIEYTALGKKIVSSNLHEVKLLGFPNIVVYDENKGVEELVEGIITAFNNDINPQETRKLAYEYTWEDVAQQFNKVIKDVIGQNKGNKINRKS